YARRLRQTRRACALRRSSAGTCRHCIITCSYRGAHHMTTTAARATGAAEGFKPWTRPEMAARLARDIPEGWCVNLGIGIPLLVSNFVKGREVIFQSEN